MARIKSDDWRNLPIENWNINSFHAYIIERTAELYVHTYAPGGSGSKSNRWMREKGMLKQAQERYGNRVLREFLDVCWREYRTNKPDEFPYPSFTFMYAYMDRYFNEAQAAVAKGMAKAQREAQAEARRLGDDEISDWL